MKKILLTLLCLGGIGAIHSPVRRGLMLGSRASSPFPELVLVGVRGPALVGVARPSTVGIGGSFGCDGCERGVFGSATAATPSSRSVCILPGPPP